MAKSLVDVAADAASDVAAESVKSARRLMDEGKSATKEGLRSAAACFENEVTSRPYRTVAIAAGLGVLIGMLMMRR